MIRVQWVRLDQLEVDDDLVRTRSSRVFEEHLAQSITAIGLAEPLKVARAPQGRLVVVDGVLRLRALRVLSEQDRARYAEVPVYFVPYEKRYEIRFQTDIYQDLLPSQLARLVEHLHIAQNIPKKELARYLGVSASTLRNYTGVWRLVSRGGLFARLVDLMDRGIVPASNPYAWLRLTQRGIKIALEILSRGEPPEDWIKDCIRRQQAGNSIRVSIREVQEITDSLPNDCYRGDQALRETKKDLGLRRRRQGKGQLLDLQKRARNHANQVAQQAEDSVLVAAARALFQNLN